MSLGDIIKSMTGKIIRSSLVTLIFIGFGSLSYAFSIWLENWSSKELTATFFILAATHFIFRVFIYYTLVANLGSGRVRYTLSKVLTLTHLFIASLFILRVWLPDSAALLAAYGFIAAAIAFSIQDVFKNAIGGVLILIRNLYRVGDRVQLGKDYGDVLDVGILYTRVLEIQNWVTGDQPTGRIISVPNGIVISASTHNYTADHTFIWDEIHVPITYQSNWQKAEAIMKEVVAEHTEQVSVMAKKEIELLRDKYYLTNNSVEPNVYIQTTDNWISMYLRYIVNSRERRDVNSRIHRDILARIQKEKKINIASATMSISTKIEK